MNPIQDASCFVVLVSLLLQGLTPAELRLPEDASLWALLRDGQTVRLDSDTRLQPDAVSLSPHEYISRKAHRRAVVGDSAGLVAARLVVRKVQDGRILLVGLRLPYA